MAIDARDPAAVRDAAREILSRPEFVQERQTWWDKVVYYALHPVELVALGLQKLFDLFFGSGAASWIAWGIAIVAGVLIIAGVVWLTRSTSVDNVALVSQAPVSATKKSKDLLAAAEQFEKEGRWRDAIRARYSALVARLSENGVVKRRPGRTTGEYEREVAQNAPAAQPSFTSATRLFELVWYGNAEPTREDAERFRTLAASTTKQVAV